MVIGIGVSCFSSISGISGTSGVIELADEVGAPDAPEGGLNVAAFLGLVPEEELALGQLLALRLGAEYGLERVGVEAGVPSLGGNGHGRGREVLHLLKMEVQPLGLHGEFGHVFLAASGMAADEVGDDLLVETLLAADAVEDALELVEELERGLAHEP